MKAVVAQSVPELSSEEVEFLRGLGLSDHEVQVYGVMSAAARPMSAQDIASLVMVFPNAVYRVFKTLEKRGLVRFVGSRPIRYKAVAQQQGFSAAYSSQKTELEGLLGKVLKSENATSEQQITTVVGRKQMYKEYVRLASAAQHEIAVFAIGIAYSSELLEVQTAAIKRGVYIRHVVQQVQPENYHIISKWQRIGVKMRYFKEDRGFHLTLVDQSTAMVTFSNPEDTEDRFTVVISQKFAVRLFQAQFESIWQNAHGIDKYNHKV
jgi:sugar-specific transcriptional regulator TrmB